MTVDSSSAEVAPAARDRASTLSPARILAALPIVVTGAGLALAFAISFHRAFQVDEVETIHAAYAIATGKLVYRDFWQGHHPLLYLGLGALLPIDDPVLAFRLCRLLTFAMFCGTILLAGRLAGRLGGHAWLTAGLLVLHSTFVERGIEVRPDSLMTLLIVAALFVGAADRRSALARAALQGALLGLAFVATQKAAIACLAFGCVWLVAAFRARDWRLVVVPCVVFAVPFATMLAALALADGIDAYLLYNWIHPGQTIGGEAGAAAARFSPLPLLLLEWKRNVAFVVAALVGVAGATTAMSRQPNAGVLPAAAVGAVWLAGLFFMPFPYPYSHVGGLPALAVVIGVAIPALVRRTTGDDALVSRPVAVVALLLLLAAAANSGPRLIGEPARSNRSQLALLERVQALTGPGDPVFDLAGLYFRPDAYPVYLMTGAHFVRYRNGDYPPIAAWLREHGLSLFVVNYRMRWLEGEDRDFLQSHFIRVEPNLFLSGSALVGFPAEVSKPFEVTRDGEYRFDGDGELHVDDQRFTRGVLQKGVHRLTSPTGILSGRIVLARAPAMAAAEGADRPLFHAFD